MGESIIAPSARQKAERPRSVWPLLLFTFLALGALVAVPLLILQPRNAAYTVKSYETALVNRQTIEDAVGASGTVVSKAVRVITAPVSGTLETLSVQEGDDVKSGQVIGQLRSADLDRAITLARATLLSAQEDGRQAVLTAQQAVSTAQFALDAAQAALAAPVRAAQTALSLERIGAISRAERMDAQVKAQVAQGEVESMASSLRLAQTGLRLAQDSAAHRQTAAQADLIAAQQTRADATVRASMNGRVVAVKVAPGAVVSTGVELLTIASLTQVRVDAQLEESLAEQVKVGQRVRLTLGDRTLAGTVSRVGSAASTGAGQSDRTIPAQVEFDVAPGRVLLGTTVGVNVTVSRLERALSLPRGAYLTTGEGRLAYVVKDGRAQRRDIVLGAQSAERVEIKQGLAEGERVIISSYEAYKDQVTVRVAPDGDLRKESP